MASRSRIPLRPLLGALSLAGIVPTAIVAAVLLATLWRTQQHEIHDSAQATAHALAASVGERLESTLQRLRLLVFLAPPESAEALALRAPDILSANPDWSAVLLRRPSPKVSDLVSPPDETPAIEVAVPLPYQPELCVVAVLRPESLAQVLRLRSVSAAEGTAIVVDGANRIIARSDGQGRAGDAYSARPGAITAPITGTTWNLVLAMRSAGAGERLTGSLGALGALLVLLLLTGALFSWLIVRRLATEIGAGAEAAAELSDGRRPSGLRSRVREVQTLIDALERAFARLAEARAAREQAEAERERTLAAERAAREQGEAASARSERFLATLAHELRNPLGAIANAARVLERMPPASPDHKAAREIIGRQTGHLAAIADQLLDLGRVSGPIVLRRNLLDLAHATTAAARAVRASTPPPGHEWQLDLHPALVSADATRLDQVLACLLGNAVRFTPPGGRIRVRLSNENGQALLSIEDSGPGIRPDLLAHIFTESIGLALARRLVELHGGRLSAENLSPCGARFSLRLPAIPEPELRAAHEVRALPAPRPARQARVLIVEDNEDARVMLQRLLQGEGHLVSAARDAASGLEAALAASPDIALVDIGLPDMDGYQLGRSLRERLGNRTLLIALTGYGTAGDRERAAAAGFDTHLTKPVDFDRLLALVTEAGA